jgi:hypothetical protein
MSSHFIITNNKLDRFKWFDELTPVIDLVFEELYEEYYGEDAFYDENMCNGATDCSDLDLECIEDIINRILLKFNVKLTQYIRISKKDLIYYKRYIISKYFD